MLGNTWIDAESEYYESISLFALWLRLGSPPVDEYVVNGRTVGRSRTPAGRGYGEWEPNPEFDWEGHRSEATAFRVRGFSGTLVTRLEVQT